jgi:Fe-S cluster biogenesis protein NfuA
LKREFLILFKIEKEILKALESIRPYLQADNGDVELVEVSDDGIVKVKLTGECENCPMSVMTLRAGIERSLMRQVPGIRRIEAVT